MERFIYTKREMQIIQTKRPLAITDEEFLALYRKAFQRDKIEHIIHLGDVYPEIESRVCSNEFIAAHNDPADREDSYPHPILCPANRNTEARIKDLVCYLTGRMEWTKSLRHQLCIVVPYRLVFNYWLDEYVKDYVTEQLWEKFFLGQEELSQIIKLREISGIDELTYRAVVYFDRYTSSSSCMDMDGTCQRETSYAIRRVGKRVPAFFNGDGGISNRRFEISNRVFHYVDRTYNRNIPIITGSFRTNIEEEGE